MTRDLDTLLKALDDAPSMPVDHTFVSRLDRRIGVEDLVVRERRAIRGALTRGAISAGSILLSGAMVSWLAPDSGPSVAVAVATGLCFWMLFVDWGWPDVALIATLDHDRTLRL